MDVQDLAFVGCRLVALYFGIQALQLVPTVFSVASLPFTSTANGGPEVWLLTLGQIVGLAIWGGAGVSLWTYAQPISGLIAPRNRSRLMAQVSRDDIQQVLFAAVGLSILVNAAADLSETLCSWYAWNALKSRGLESLPLGHQPTHSFVAGAKALVGLLLVFGSSGLVGAINRFRQASGPASQQPGQARGDE